jgi:hypothetical protein
MDLPKHIISAEKNAKMDYKVAIQCTLPSPLTFFLLINSMNGQLLLLLLLASYVAEI